MLQKVNAAAIYFMTKTIGLTVEDTEPHTYDLILAHIAVAQTQPNLVSLFLVTAPIKQWEMKAFAKVLHCEVVSASICLGISWHHSNRFLQWTLE